MDSVSFRLLTCIRNHPNKNKRKALCAGMWTKTNVPVAHLHECDLVGIVQQVLSTATTTNTEKLIKLFLLAKQKCIRNEILPDSIHKRKVCSIRENNCFVASGNLFLGKMSSVLKNKKTKYKSHVV